MAIRGRYINLFIVWMAGTIVVLLAVTVPAAYFAVGWQSEDAALRTEAKLYALQMSAIINRNPTMWMFEVARIEGLLLTASGDERKESFRVLGPTGNPVTQHREELPPPVMTRSHPLRDSGAIVGSLEISRSMHDLVVNTLGLALLSGTLGMALFFLVRIYPMSALREALDQLMSEKERAQITLRSIGDGVISTDPDGRVLLVNRIAERLTGWTEDEARGKTVGAIFPQEGEHLVARDGSRRRIETNMSPISDEIGRTIGFVLVFRDMEEKVRIVRELLKAKKLESLGILAGGIAHEIRNPLSGITISLTTLERVFDRSEVFEPQAMGKIRLILEEMKSAASKMSAVVQRVMDFSRPAPPRMEKVDLNAIIKEAVHLSSSTLRKRGVSLSLGLHPDLPTCRADPQLIEQVLVNLIVNAYQAMEGTAGEKRLEIGSGVRDGNLLIRVADSGPGISLSLREKIFDPFFTTRKDGTGIGLSFSQRIVGDHGGKLYVDESRWGGAEFRIELPVTGEGAPA